VRSNARFASGSGIGRYNNAPDPEDCSIKALPRIFLRLAMGAAAFLLVGFAALVIWLRYFALPEIDQYRPQILASIERASGMAVDVRKMRGGWGGLRPVLALEGVSIRDRAGRAAFLLERAEVTLSWWSLFAGQVRFHDVDFHRPDLVLRRGADGLIYVADKPLNAAGPSDEGAFTEWLLAQPRLGIHDATLAWCDDFVGAAEVRLTGVEIAIENRGSRHRAALTATPPRELARRIDLRADVRLVREGREWRARGEAYAEAASADLARLRDHLPVPETLRSGVGSARLWLSFNPHGVTEATGDVTLRDARVQLAADALPLDLATLSGRAIYRAGAEGFSLATEDLRFRLASGVEARPGRFSLARTARAGAAPRVEVKADGIDVKIAATLLDYFPVPRETKNHALRFAPRGRIADAVLAWTDDGAKSWNVKGRFENLAVNAVEAFPGATGLTGSIEGDEKGGVLRLASKRASFEASRIFAAPIALDELDAVARWKRGAGGLEVAIEQARIANADGELRATGLWRAPTNARGGPGIVDFEGTLSRVVAPRVAAYLPNTIAPVRSYLERSILAGEVTSARFAVNGDLWEFPFGRDGVPGLFLVEGSLRDGKLVYHPEWPAVDAIEGKVRFENRSMEIHASRAAIFASRVRSASATIANFGARPIVLAIDGEVESTGADAARFLRESPLANGAGAFTKVVAVEGPGRLKLHLDFPLSGPDPARIAGEYQFAGASAGVGRFISMKELRGKLAFSERGVRAPEITGTMFGRPATLALATEPDGRVAATIEGRIDSTTLGAHLPEAIAARLDGNTAWKARVLSGGPGVDIVLTSDLSGMASRLPHPLDKPPEAARALAIRLAQAGTAAETVSAELAGNVYWRSSRGAGPADTERWQVAVKMGAAFAQEPLRDGLWLYGEANSLDADAWVAVFPDTPVADGGPAAAQRFGLRGLDMRLARVRYLGREFAQIAAKLEHHPGEWRGTLDSPLIAGAVQWQSGGRGRLAAQLARLSIPEPPAEAASTPPASHDPPALDVVAERFTFRGRELGKLEVKADYERRPAGAAEDPWRISKLDITNPHSQWRSSGGWRRTGAGAITTLDFKLESSNLNALFGQLGYGDYLKRGTGELQGNFAWPGFPADFSTSILSGSFDVKASRGQFAKLEPGAGKLLGLLSLQSLPRRVTLDFRDVFSEGFAFETIEGSVKIARGILVTESFAINGPAALVSIAGEVSLPRETQSIHLRVVPEMGEGAAIAATVLGTPVLGLSTLLVSKLLKNPLGTMVAYEYQVTGSWDNPVVTKISAPPPAPPAPAAPAKAATAEAQK
jgi:uncharacterized protein (TIGR02099 family)